MNKKVFIFIQTFYCIILLLAFSLTASASGSISESEFIANELQRAMKESAELSTEWSNIVGIGLSNGKSDTYNNTVYINDENDKLFLIIDFANGSNADYMLKIFVDYIETEFQINSNRYTEYYFSAAATDGFALNLRLPPESIDLRYAHTITVALFKDPQLQTSTISTDTNAYSTDFTLISAKEPADSPYKAAYNHASDFYTIPFSGIMLNCDLDLKDDNEVFFPPAILNAAPNEKVTLAYRAAGYDTSENLLFFLLLDWKQVDINGYPYLFTEAQYPLTNCGYITFDAPDTPGQYELVALMSSAPFELRTADNSWFNFASTRFALNVTNASNASN